MANKASTHRSQWRFMLLTRLMLLQQLYPRHGQARGSLIGWR